MGPLDLTEEESEYEDERQRLFRESEPLGIEDVGGCRVCVAREIGNGSYECSEEAYRIITEYEAVRRRQAEAEDACMAARGWEYAEQDLAEEDEPAPEAVPPEGKLTARQALFCENYAARPVATRAAVLAGYSEDSAHNQGHRLLKNPQVLTRIAALRAARNLRYVIEPDTLQDKLEAVFFDALSERNHSAAVAALRLQAGLARLPTRPAAAADAKTRPARKRKPGRRGAHRNDEKRRGRGRKNDEK